MNHSNRLNRRKHQRYRLPPMYSTVTVQCQPSAEHAELLGHVYDISEGGARIELDEPMNVGQSLEFKLALPGAPREVNAVGKVVWVNDAEDDPGPRRMAVEFTDFASALDQAALRQCLSASSMRAAA